MKHFLILFPLLALLLGGCSNNDIKEINNAAYNYLDALGNYRIDDARPYASELTQERTLDFFARLLPAVDTNYIRKNTPAEVTIKGVVKLDDSTARAYFTKKTPIVLQDDSLTLIREKGRWVVDAVIDFGQGGKRSAAQPASVPAGEATLLKKSTPAEAARP